MKVQLILLFEKMAKNTASSALCVDENLLNAVVSCYNDKSLSKTAKEAVLTILSTVSTVPESAGHHLV